MDAIDVVRNVRSLLEALPDVVGFVVTDEDGCVVEAADSVTEPEMAAAQVALVAHEMKRLSSVLGLGPGEHYTIQGQRTTRVIALQGDAIAALELDAKRQVADVERKLRACDWAGAAKPAVTEPPVNAAPPPPPRRAATPPPVPPPPPTVAAPSPPPPLPIAAAPSATPPPLPRMDRTPAFAGDLHMFSVPDLLEFLRNGQRTGTLVCRSALGHGVISLRRGKITNAMSPAAADLGTYLARDGVLTTDKLHEVLGGPGAATPSDTVLARFVFERGLVTAKDLRAALRARIRDAVRHLISWVDGRFTFDPAGLVEPLLPGLDMEIDSQPLLLNMFRELDEAARTG